MSRNCPPICRHCKNEDHLIKHYPTRPLNKNQSRLNQPSNPVLAITNNSGTSSIDLQSFLSQFNSLASNNHASLVTSSCN